MKKIFYLCTMLFTVLIISGCGKDPEKLLEEANKKMEKVEQANFYAEINMSFKADDSVINLDMNMDGALDTKKGLYHYKMNMKSFGVNSEIEIYMEQKDDKLFTYTKEEDSDWYQSESDSDTMLDSKKYQINKFKKVEKVRSDEKGLTRLKVTFDKKDINDMLKKLDEEMSQEFEFENDIVVYVYINKDNYIEKMYFDLADNLDLVSLMGLDEYNNMTIDECSFMIKYSDFNNIKEIEIPSIDNTTKYTEEAILEDIVLSAELICEDKNINFTNYNGELDDYLDLQYYDINQITKGIITTSSDCSADITEDFTINGKTCTYDDYQAICE